jgi:hypothetical protein
MPPRIPPRFSFNTGLTSSVNAPLVLRRPAIFVVFKAIEKFGRFWWTRIKVGGCQFNTQSRYMFNCKTQHPPMHNPLFNLLWPRVGPFLPLFFFHNWGGLSLWKKFNSVSHKVWLNNEILKIIVTCLLSVFFLSNTLS